MSEDGLPPYLPMDLPETSQRRLVVAIDYGTTYTGIAFATPAGHRANLHEIDVIKDWAPSMGNLDKVPSVISYSDSSDAQEEQWGSSLSPDAVAMVHTKLQLEVHKTSEELDLILQALDGMSDLNFQRISSMGGLPSYTWKGPEQIVEDYFSKVFDAFLEAINGTGLTKDVRALILTDIVVTIPAGWSYRAKNSIFRAFTQAGFNPSTFPKLRDIMVVSEPEAAAIYTSRYLKERDGAEFLKLGECFVLCDAGGGTVDVVAYRVKALEPTFEIEAVTLATGYKCGSIFVDIAFKKWLKALLGDQHYRAFDQGQIASRIDSHDSEGKHMRRLMKEFTVHKRKFRKGQREIRMDLPPPLHNLNLHNKVVGGEITITYDDMQSFFQPSVEKIVDLIRGQISQVEKLHARRLKNVFLVGGFAESEYLQESIAYSLRLRNKQIRRPDTSWTAVVRGAAIFAIEKSTIALSKMSPSLQSYGISASASYSEIDHESEDHNIDSLTGISLAMDQLLWMIKKGDLVLSNEPTVEKRFFTKNFLGSGLRSGSIPIYAYGEDDIPDRLHNSLAELTVLHTLEYDLMNIPLDEFECRRLPGVVPFYVARLSIEMRLDPQMLQVELCCKGRTLCSVEIPCENTNTPTEYDEY